MGRKAALKTLSFYSFLAKGEFLKHHIVLGQLNSIQQNLMMGLKKTGRWNLVITGRELCCKLLHAALRTWKDKVEGPQNIELRAPEK